jgi:hypothetical protein
VESREDRRRLRARRKRPSARRGRIARHIKPLLGALTVASVTREDVDQFMHDVAAGRTAANVKTVNRGFARVRGGG